MISDVSVFFSNTSFMIVGILTLTVILVNGWTDAPNAIATCVSTRALRPKQAVRMAAIFNLMGVLTMTSLNSSVAYTIFKIADFGSDSKKALIALCAALSAIIIWSVAAWAGGIPTSESHALIAGLSGAAIALQGGSHGISKTEWIKVLDGLLLSLIVGFALGFMTAKVIGHIFCHVPRQRSFSFFRRAQVIGGASMAFLHGAQDGQKFMGVFMLGIALSKGQISSQFQVPLWLMLLCSVVMAFGTSVGGYRIIKSVGMDMVKLKKYQGFSADLASGVCLLFACLSGWPVSTTHTKATAVMGVGAAKRITSVNWGIAKNMVLTWLFTFPGCGFLGFQMAKLFMNLNL